MSRALIVAPLRLVACRGSDACMEQQDMMMPERRFSGCALLCKSLDFGATCVSTINAYAT